MRQTLIIMNIVGIIRPINSNRKKVTLPGRRLLLVLVERVSDPSKTDRPPAKDGSETRPTVAAPHAWRDGPNEWLDDSGFTQRMAISFAATGIRPVGKREREGACPLPCG